MVQIKLVLPANRLGERRPLEIENDVRQLCFFIVTACKAWKALECDSNGKGYPLVKGTIAAAMWSKEGFTARQ